jgi:hypothetical protein
VFWTASKRMHALPPEKIRYLYFGVLFAYGLFGLTMLLFVPEPSTLLKIATSIYNFALGFSCWHVVAVNSLLLPKELRPSLIVRSLLALVGVFFWTIATVAAIKLAQDLLS